MKKKIYIPGYIRANGDVVNGHYREMTEGKTTRSVAARIGWAKRKMRLKA